MNPFSWVSQGSIRKFDRAIYDLKAAKQEVNEASVKALYVKYGGLVLETNAPEVAEAAAVKVKKHSAK